jgi:invasion protein IalB
MRRAVLSLLALAALSGAAAAQPAVGTPPKPATAGKAGPAPAAAAAAATAAPKRFGEFVVRCAPVKSVAPCDLYEERGDKNSGQRVIGFSIGFMPSTSRYIMQVAVPLGVDVSKGVTITDGKYTSPMLPYRRCDRTGCFTEVAIDKSLIAAFTKMGADAKIKVIADGGKVYDFTFSFDGFGAAHDDMVAQNRAKAASPENASDAK